MNKHASLAIFLLATLMPGGAAFAQVLVNPLKTTSLTVFLMEILQFVIQIGTVVVVLMLVFVGFKFVTAQGNESKLTEARQMLLWTIIGALVLLGSQVIASTLCNTVNAISSGTGPAVSCP